MLEAKAICYMYITSWVKLNLLEFYFVTYCRQNALVVERHNWQVVDLQKVSHISDPTSITICMGNNNNGVTTFE